MGRQQLFSKDDIEFIKNNYQFMTCAEIANVLGFTTSQVKGKVDKLHLPRKKRKINDDYFNNIDFITFAYEPIYAIGTGALPSIDRIKEVVEFVSKYLEDIYHKKPRIIYGGSVDSSNIRNIMNISGLSGVMIGAISSDIKEVERIIKNI